MVEPARIVGISKTTYVLATPRCLDWRHDLPRTSTSNDPSDSDPLDPCRRPASRHRGDRRPRLPVAGVLVLDEPHHQTASCSEHRGARGEALPSTVWPAHGQAAFVQTGQSQIQAGPNQHAAAIASVAKVMTAYVVLRDHPLRPGEDGPTITLTDADVADTDRRRRQRGVGRAHRRRRAIDRTAGAAGAAAAVGEQHRRGSGAMGRRLDGPVCCPDECHRTVAGHDPHPLHRPERLRRRNRVDCRRPGAHCRSGHAPARVCEHRRHPSATLPVAGTVHNTNTLLGHNGFVGVKTGSTAAAGGCFAFRAIRWIDGKRTTITGVVLGQPGYDKIAGLAAAHAMVDRIARHSPRQVPAMPDLRQRTPAAVPKTSTTRTTRRRGRRRPTRGGQ